MVESYPGTTLVAVSKTADVNQIRRAYNKGVRHFGENRVQDAIPKIAEVDLPVDWHFVGRLQTRKVRKIAGYFSLVHSLDSLKLAQEMDNVGESTGSPFKCLIQVNASGEESKQGLSIGEVPLLVEQTQEFRFLRITGLMTMAPVAGNPQDLRPLFRSVRQLFEELSKERRPHLSMQHLSMGMSSDYEVALDEGANMVRVGSAIFSNI